MTVMPNLVTANNAPSSEVYSMECKLTVSKAETLGDAQTVTSLEFDGFASLEVVNVMLEIMREVVE